MIKAGNLLLSDNRFHSFTLSNIQDPDHTYYGSLAMEMDQTILDIIRVVNRPSGFAFT